MNGLFEIVLKDPLQLEQQKKIYVRKRKRCLLGKFIVLLDSKVSSVLVCKIKAKKN